MAQRRPNGTGSISMRSDGRWQGAVSVLMVGGGRKRVSAGGKTAQEVEEKLTAVKQRSYQGIPVSDRDWKVGEFLDHWLEHAVSIKRRPLTYERHESIVRLHLKPGLGDRRLFHLDVRTTQEYFDQLYRQGQTVSQIHHIRKVLSAALTYAMRQEILYRNPARLVELPSYHPRETDYWSTNEAAQFLAVAQDEPLYPAFELLVLYGLRRGEALGLRWRDVDFAEGVIRIRQQVQRIGGTLQQAPLKTYTSKRDVPMLQSSQQSLSAQRSRQLHMHLAAGSEWQGGQGDDTLVFTTKTGRPIDPRNLHRSFQRICDEHNLQQITVHAIRHTNATTQKKLLVHARDIQAILGHGDIRTTGVYTHVELDSKREALEKVEQVFFGDRLGPETGTTEMLSRAASSGLIIH